MSKIKVDIDTEKKTMTVTKDGETLEDVAYISCYGEESYMGFSCYVQMESEEEGGMRRQTTITAEQLFAELETYEKEKENR